MSGLYVEVYKPESLQKALNTFRRKVEAAGLLRELRQRKAYASPGEKQRRKRKRASLMRQKASRVD